MALRRTEFQNNYRVAYESGDLVVDVSHLSPDGKGSILISRGEIQRDLFNLPVIPLLYSSTLEGYKIALSQIKPFYGGDDLTPYLDLFWEEHYKLKTIETYHLTFKESSYIISTTPIP